MISQGDKKKTYKKYIVIFMLFFIAGFCQYIDNKTGLFGDEILGVLANLLFLFILITWFVSIRERIVDKITRKYLLMIAFLMLVLMMCKFIKYKLVYYDFFIRLLWYMYYIPECLIPVLMLLCSIQIDRKGKNDINMLWHLLFIPAFLFVILFLTNDLHNLCFAFKPNFENYGSDYSYGFVFYLALGFNVVVILSAAILSFYKCKVSAVRKRIWIPISLFISSIVFGIVALIIDFESFKIPELLCLICISLIESLIAIGFIPSNYNYKRYFYLSNINAVITDRKLDIYVYSNNSLDIINNQLSIIKNKDVYTIDNLRYRKNKINGGYVFWVEDLSTINYLNNQIQEISSELVGENDLLIANNALKEEKARIDEQHKLYQLIDKKTRKQTRKVKGLLDNASKQNNNIKLACIYTAYIKRRSNLLILHEKDSKAHIDELMFAINESISYLSLYGVSCSLISIKKEYYFDIEIIELMYDFFEECIEKALPSLNALLVKISNNKNILSIRIYYNSANEYIDKEWNKKKIDKYNGIIEVCNNGDDDNYALLSLEVNDNDTLL